MLSSRSTTLDLGKPPGDLVNCSWYLEAVTLSSVDRIIICWTTSLFTSIASEKDNVSSLLFNDRLNDCKIGPVVSGTNTSTGKRVIASSIEFILISSTAS